MFCFTFWKDHFHGKDFQVDQSKKNMPISRRKRKKLQLRSFARTNQTNSKNLCIIAVDSASLKTLTMGISSICLKVAWKDIILTPKPPTLFGIKIDWFWKKSKLNNKCLKLSVKLEKIKMITRLQLWQNNDYIFYKYIYKFKK